MNIVRLSGTIDENRLSAQVPTSIRSGSVTVLVLPVSEDDKARVWTAGIGHEWADELSDPDQDIYTLSDGEPVRESRRDLFGQVSFRG